MPIPEYKMGNMVVFNDKLWLIRKTSYNPHVTVDGYIFGYALVNCNDGDDSFAWAYEEDLTFVADGNCMLITWLEELGGWTRVIYAGGKNIRQEIEGLQENIKEEIVSQLQKQKNNSFYLDFPNLYDFYIEQAKKSEYAKRVLQLCKDNLGKKGIIV